MNKLRYRIVFNKTRGMCMAVQERARSRTKGPGQGVVDCSVPSAMRLPALRRMSFLLAIGLGCPLLTGTALGQIVADPKAPGQQQATVLNAANGVLQVNIQTPSAAGVSRNVYSQFDVPKSGAVLNNSRSNVQTQLGGWLQGNPWLSKGTARVILNEVNSSDPSRLQGYIEVAGDRAETIIANPAGIVVDGGGFINVSRATLTTGSPTIEDGFLKGYSVERGQIVIQSGGLDASTTDYTALIARSLQVNARLWAQRLNVITGTNQVEETTQAKVTHTLQASDAPPLFAVDVARLGGMYANQIYLLGTEAGVGVRNAGEIGAAAGDLIVTANGRLENTGTLSASQRLQAEATAIENHGAVQATAALALRAGSLRNAGQIGSAAETLLAVQGDLDNGGGRIEAPRIELTSATLRNAGGSIVQTGTSALTIDAEQVVNAGGTLGRQATPAAGGTAGIGGSSQPADPAAPPPAGTTDTGGTGSTGTSASTTDSVPVVADGLLKTGLADNSAGLIAANGVIAVRTGAFDNHGGQAYLDSLSVSGPAFDNTAGALSVVRGFTARTDSFVNDQGKLLVGAAFDAGLGRFSNRQGLLQAGRLAVDVTGTLDNSGGTLRQLGGADAVFKVGADLGMNGGTVDVAAGLQLNAGSISGSGSIMNVSGDLNVDSGATSAVQGKWLAGGAASLRTGDLDNRGGVISAAGKLSMTTASLDNGGGTIAGGSDVAIAAATVSNDGGTIQAARDLVLAASGAVDNHAGTIETLSSHSQLGLSGASIANDGGRIANAGDGNTAISARTVDNGGVIGGNGNVGIAAQALTNAQDAVITSLGDMDMQVSGILANAGRINAGGAFSMVQRTALLKNSGTLMALGAIRIDTASVDNSRGTIATVAGSNGALSLKTGSLVNREGSIQSDGRAALEVAGAVDNVLGHIRAGADLGFTAGGRIENQGGTIETSGRMQVRGGEIGNQGGRIVAAGTGASSIEADRTIDNGGLIGANGDFTLKAEALNNGAAGTVSAIGNLDLAVRGLLANKGGTISSAGTLTSDQAGAALVNSGAITAAGDARLHFGQVDNSGGAISTLQGANLTLQANALVNRAGHLMAGADATLGVTGDVDNAGGVLQAAVSLDVRAGGAFANQGGVIEALGTHGTLVLRTDSLDNTGGRIVNAGDGAALVSAAGHVANAGVIAGNGKLDLAAATLDNSGTVSSGSGIGLAVSQTLNNAGTISAAAGLYSEQADANLRNSGTIVAGGAVALTVKSIDNGGGKLATAQGSNADMLLSAQNISNQGGAIMADRNADFLVKDAFDNRAGLIQAKSQLGLDAGGLLDASAGRIETLSADSTLQVHAGSVLNQAGRIVNAGSGDTGVRADTTLVNSGQIAGNGVLRLEAQSAINEAEGSITAGGALALQVHASLDNAGSIGSRATLSMIEAGAVLTNHGSMVANGEVAIRAAAIDNDGGTLATAGGSGASVNLRGASLTNRDGRIVAERALLLDVDGALDNSRGKLHGVDTVQLTAGATLTNDGGTIEATGAGATLVLQAGAVHNGDGRIVNVGDGATTVTVADSLENKGLVAGNGRLDVGAASLDNEAGGTLASRASMTLTVGTRMDNAGTVSGGATLDIAAAGATVRNAGLVVAKGALGLDSAAFDNDGGQLATANGSGAALRIGAASISNRAGAILADHDAQVTSADGIDNAGGALQAGGTLGLDAAGRVGNDGGVIEALDPAAALTLHAGTVDNGGGRIVNVGAGATSVTVDGKLTSSGLVAGNGSLEIAVADLDNQAGGSIVAGTTLALTASSVIANAGAIGSHGDLTVAASQATVRNSGQIVSSTGVTLDTGAFDNGGGQLVTVKDGGGDIVLRAASVANVGGAIVADGAARVTAAAAVDNRAGTLHANGALALDAGGALGNQGGVIDVAGASATLDMHSASIDNSGGYLVNAGGGTTRIGADGDILNSGTLAGNGSVDLRAATVHNQAGGTLAAGVTLDIHASQGLDNAGALSAAGALTMDQAGARIRNSGGIAAGGRVLLHGASIANDGGQIATQSGAGIVLDSESTLSNRGGSIAAAGDATLDAFGAYDNSKGQVQAAGRLHVGVGSTLTNNGGALEALGAASTLDLQAAAVDNTAGRIVNAGGGATTIASASSIVNSGTVAGNGTVDISSLSLQNMAGGVIGAGSAMELAVRQQLDNLGGIISAGGSLHFGQAAASFSNSGRIGAGGTVDITAAAIVNNGGELYTVNNSGAAVLLQAGSLGNTGGTIAADGLLRAGVAGALTNNGGTLHGGRAASIGVGGTLANGSGTIEAASGTLDVQAQSLSSSGRIVNAGSGATTLTSAGSIVNSGTIAGNGTVDLHASTLQDQAGGQVASGSALLLDVRQQLTNAGTVSSGGTLRFEQSSASFRNSGQIAAAGDATFIAASFNNDGGKISTVDGSGADIRVTAPALSNHGGAILADGDATFSFVNGADNSQGTLQAGRDLVLTTSGNVGNAGGVIEGVGAGSSVSVDGAAIDNGSGRISNVGSGDTRLSSRTTIINAGVIAASGKLLLAGQVLHNQSGGTIASGSDMELAITQQLANQGEVNSGGTLTFDQAGATFSNSGKVFAGGNALITARLVDNNGGELGTGSGSSADMVLTSDQLSNQGGRIATDRDLAVSTHSVAAMGELFSGRDLALTMDGDYVQGAGAQQFHANRDLSLTVTGNITNGSTFGAVGTLTLSGQQISNQAGATIEGKGVVLKASGNLSNAGEINGANTLDITAANVSNSGGIVGGDVTVATGNLDNTGAAALVGATGALALSVNGTLNNTGGATLYSSGDMTIGGQGGGSVGTVNNISSTIEAAGSLALSAATLNNIRENVQIVKVKTVDETVHMSMPSWYQLGDNHDSFETSAANYWPHEVYFVNPSDILDDQVYVTPDGYTIHRAVIQTHVNDSAFYVAGSGLYSSYGMQQRLTLSEGTRVIYYRNGGPAANPDQGGPASNVLSYAPWVTHWPSSTISFSNQYGNCSSDCIRLDVQPSYDDPRTTILRDTVRSLAPVREKLEVSRDAHYTAVEDQLASGAGAAAQILAGGNMRLTVGSALNNQYSDIKGRGILDFGGSAPKINLGATLYRTYTFDGTWRTVAGDVVAYQQPSISEAIGLAAGVIEGKQGVSISGRSFANVDVTAGTVGNIRAAVNVIGSGASGAASAGAHATAGTVSGAATGVSASGSAPGGVAALADAAIARTGSSGLAAGLMASASGVANRLQADVTTGDSGYINKAAAGAEATTSGASNGLATIRAADGSGETNDNRVSGAVAAAHNGAHLGNVFAASGPSAGQQAASVQGTALGSVIKVAPSGLFIRNPDPNGSYLYETRSQFADQKQWTSSDYLLNQLAFDPATTQKRLGDGFYEQRMVREQLAELTGHASGAGASDDSTYLQLLSNAVSIAKEVGLRPGVALSAEQVGHLTSDIVWMESQTVMLPDGSVETVLVPKVYLAHVGKHALQPGGALVTGNGVTIDTTESIVNSGGVIDGGNGRTLLVAGLDIVNRGGTIKGGSVALVADRDVKNESLAVKDTYDFGQNSGSYTSLSNVATIAATGTLDIMAGRDLSDLAGRITAGSATLTAGQNVDFGTIRTGSAYQSEISSYTEKNSSIVHQLSQISTGGDLKIAATGNLNLSGTQVAIGTASIGTGQLLAGGTITIGAVTNEINTSVKNDPSSKQYDKQVHQNQAVVGSLVNATGGLIVGAGVLEKGAINITASSITAGDALKVTASDSVNIVSAHEQHLSDTALTLNSSSFLKSKATQSADYVASSQAIGSTLSGRTVDISAGKDINVLGSAIAGDGDVSLAALGSVNIGASTSTLTEQHHKEVKESGFLSGNGFGFSFGTRTTTTDQSRDATTQNGQSRSMVGSLGGDLSVVAGDAIKVSGSDLAAGKNMSLDGRSVTIDPGQDKSKGKFEQASVQDGLTLAVGGSVVNAIQAFQSMSSAASQSKDTRVTALAALTAAMAAKDAAADIAQNGLNVSLSLTIGHSESKYTQTTSDLLNSGSVLNAGNDITIRASGGDKDSNINVIGSELNAKGNITLQADNRVNLLAAQDKETQHSESKTMSAAAGIGASVGTSGTSIGYTASVSASRGNTDGEGTTQSNTHVTAGNQLTITSGGDTNLKGAVASGNQVVANVGGNLSIESLQDKATFDSKNQSVSVSGTAGVGVSVTGSVSQSKMHNDYASVQEQSGIRAGDGGFQVSVGGNTDLKGGVISGTAAGADASSLVTGTLTYSDITNHATASASTVGIGGSATIAGTAGDANSKGDDGIKLKNMGSSGVSASLPSVNALSSNATGVTSSGIGAGILVITDDLAQRELTGQSTVDAATGVNRNVVTGRGTSGGVTNDFNPDRMHAELAVTGAFTAAASPLAANVVGDIGKTKQDSAQREADAYALLAADAVKRADSEEAQILNSKASEAQASASSWGDNGVNRVALHAATQGLIGGMTAGSTGAVTSVSGVAGGNFGQQLGQKLGEAEADRQGLQGKSRTDLINTYQNTFATAGGAAVGLAASGLSGAGAQSGLLGAIQAANTANGVDSFNRQLHPKEVQVIKEKAQDFAKVLFATDKPTDQQTAQAQTYLAYAALADVDQGQMQANVLIGLQRDDGYLAAKKYLTTQKTTFINEAGQTQQVFTTKGSDFYEPLKYSSNNANQAYRDFFWNSAGINLPLPSNASVAEKQLYSEREIQRFKQDLKNALPGLVTGAVLSVVGKLPATTSRPGSQKAATTSLYSQEYNAAKVENNFGRDADATSGLRWAEDVNKLFAEKGYDAPFTNGTYVEVSVTKPGARSNMVVSAGQAQALDTGKPAVGAFATPDLIPSQSYARETLAITPNMKQDVSNVVQLVTTGKPTVQIQGKVAPQEPVGVYPGNGNQVFYDYPAGSVRTDYVKPLGPTQPLPVSTGVIQQVLAPVSPSPVTGK
jgi:filamentous hemagglutinin